MQTERGLRPQDLKWGDAGLIPVVIQHAQTGQVLTMAFMNREALRLSLQHAGHPRDSCGL